MTPIGEAPATQGAVRAEIENELRALFSRSASQAEKYGSEFVRLWDLAADHARGGKLLRPLLLLETYDGLRRSPETTADPQPSSPLHHAPLHDRSEVLRIAAAIEFLHFAFLLHDDVIDGDLQRRGRLNLIGELAQTGLDDTDSANVRHWAEMAGILAGNLLLSTAHQLFARAALPEQQKLRLLDVLEHTVVETTAGEFTDVSLSDGMIRPDLSNILAMTARKTASYSFELPLRAAVVLSGGSDDLEHALSIVGSHLGLAYQLQDDLLSTFGDTTTHGKDAYSDLREGKQTAIIYFARMSRSWPSMQAAFENPEMSVDDAERLRDMLRDCGAEAFVQRLIREQVDACATVLTSGGGAVIPAEVQRVVVSLLDRIGGRQS